MAGDRLFAADQTASSRGAADHAGVCVRRSCAAAFARHRNGDRHRCGFGTGDRAYRTVPSQQSAASVGVVVRTLPVWLERLPVQHGQRIQSVGDPWTLLATGHDADHRVRRHLARPPISVGFALARRGARLGAMALHSGQDAACAARKLRHRDPGVFRAVRRACTNGILSTVCCLRSRAYRSQHATCGVRWRSPWCCSPTCNTRSSTST